MRQVRRVGILVVSFGLLALTLACQREAADTRVADAGAIRAAEQDWSNAAAAKELSRTLSFYADDASMFAPNAPIATGKDAIRAIWSQEFANPGFAISWQTAKVEVSRSRDLAYTRGTYEFTLSDLKGRPFTDRGKYVVVWKKHADGNWKAVADIWNSDLPPPGAPTR